MSPVVCKNCATSYNGHYCPQCGQSSHTDKITLHYLLHDIPHSVFHIDKGFFYTLKWMFKNPGLAIREFLAGKRVKHFRPVAYVLLMSTICTLLTTLVHNITIDELRIQYPESKDKLHHGISFWRKYISLLIFIQIPILSFITWLTFRKKGYNYWEHIIGNMFLAAQMNVILLIIKIFTLGKVFMGYSPNTNFTVFMFIFMFYYSYCFKVWMEPHKKRWSLFFTLLLMNTFISLVYLTGLSLTGIMSFWWQR
jgi:hypothetical protein